MDAIFAELLDEQNLAKYKLLALNEASELKWKPIDLLNDFRQDYLQEDFRKLTTDLAQVNDFRTNYINDDFRKIYTPTDFRTSYKANDFRTKSSVETPAAPANSGFPQRAPAASSSYLGISNTKYPSNLNYTSNFVFTSNFTARSSNLTFKSSNDINEYLRMHPDYLKMSKSTIAAIVAIVTSGLVLLGGITLCILTWGTTTPALLLVLLSLSNRTEGTSLIISTGAGGLQNSISGLVYNNFSFNDFFSSVGIATSLTLITFGSGFAAGYSSGLLLAGKNLSESAVKTIGGVVGGLVGSGIRSGTFTVVTTLQGKEIEVIEIALNAFQGLLEGAASGYLGAKATLVKPNSAAATSEPVKKPAAEKVISKTKLGNAEVTVTQIFDNFGEEFSFLEGTQVHQTAKQRAYDLINKCLQKLNKNPNMAKNMLLGKVFKDRDGDLLNTLRALGRDGVFEFYEANVHPGVNFGKGGSKGMERLIFVFQSGNTAYAHGYVGTFYTAWHYAPGYFVDANILSGVI